MTADLVNLRRERKRRARTADAVEAAARRAAFGLGNQQQQGAAAERSLIERRLSGHRIDPVPPVDDD